MSRARYNSRAAQRAAPAAPPAPSASLVEELRIEVKRVVQETTSSSYPAVHARLTSVAGYQQVEEAVIGVVLHNTITPSAALALLESEWGGVA